MLKKILVSTLVFIYSFASEYAIDDTHSSVEFSIKHMMISNVKGQFKSYSGELFFDKKSMKFEKFSGEIDVKSIDTGIEKRDNHLRSDDFFNVKKFPKMIFTMKKYTKIDDEEGKMSGTLKIRDITKDITLDVEIGGVMKDPWGNQRVGFSLTGEINREDFGLKWNKLLETGGVVVGEMVKLNIEIQGIAMDD